MNAQLKKKLISLADKYENDSFLTADPSKFFHRYSSVRDREVAAFISASLAFGNRKQILSHIQMIFDDVDRTGGKKNSSPAEYILSGKYEAFFRPTGGSAKDGAGGSAKDGAGGSGDTCDDLNKSFYRVFTYANMRAMFDVLKEILTEEKTMGAYFKKRYIEACRLNEKEADARASAVSKKKSAEPMLYEIIRTPFLNRGCGNLIPYTKNSACKRIQLFLRWMVRDNSPVDMGLWKWYDKSKLLLPLDVHVLEESVKFGLLKPAGSLAQKAGGPQSSVSLPNSGGPRNSSGLAKATDGPQSSISPQNSPAPQNSVSLQNSCGQQNNAASVNKKIPSATIKMAIELTEQMKLVWPDDPVKGDYALFGLGVN